MIDRTAPASKEPQSFGDIAATVVSKRACTSAISQRPMNVYFGVFSRRRLTGRTLRQFREPIFRSKLNYHYEKLLLLQEDKVMRPTSFSPVR
jgi:hypothetical protein